LDASPPSGVLLSTGVGACICREGGMGALLSTMAGSLCRPAAAGGAAAAAGWPAGLPFALGAAAGPAPARRSAGGTYAFALRTTAP
jgi:hypothetical protein